MTKGPCAMRGLLHGPLGHVALRTAGGDSASGAAARPCGGLLDGRRAPGYASADLTSTGRQLPTKDEAPRRGNARGPDSPAPLVDSTSAFGVMLELRWYRKLCIAEVPTHLGRRAPSERCADPA